MFELADLPCQEDALEPVISARTLRLHHGKHHANYVKELNRLVEEQDIAPASLETIIRQAAKSVDRKLFDNAAQAWNHSFFWVCTTPTANRPDHALSAAVAKSFGRPSDLK